LQSGLAHKKELISKICAELLGLDTKTLIEKDQDILDSGGSFVQAIKAARMVASAVGHHVPVALLILKTILEDLATLLMNKVLPRYRQETIPFLGIYRESLTLITHLGIVGCLT
jgi:hypothetical protein